MAKTNNNSELFSNENCEMVRKIASKYRGIYTQLFDYDDAVQEGMIALFDANRTFVENIGVPFNKFASICVARRIRHNAIKGIENNESLDAHEITTLAYRNCEITNIITAIENVFSNKRRADMAKSSNFKTRRQILNQIHAKSLSLSQL